MPTAQHREPAIIHLILRCENPGPGEEGLLGNVPRSGLVGNVDSYSIVAAGPYTSSPTYSVLLLATSRLEHCKPGRHSKNPV